MSPVPLSGQRLLDLKAVVERTGVSARTWRRIIRAGQIGAVRLGGSIRIPEDDLEQYLASKYSPAVTMRRPEPRELQDIIDSVIPAKRGRPRLGVAR